MDRIALISDEPAEWERELALGMETWADIVAGVVKGTDGPFTVGLFAPWGQGKTSVLRRACYVSECAENTHSFIVNAWEHERCDDPLGPILEDILRGIDERLTTDKSADKRTGLLALKRILSVLVVAAGAFAFGAPTLALLAPGAAGTIKEVGKAALGALAPAEKMAAEVARLSEPAGGGAAASGTGLRAYLERAKAEFLPNDKVVVFIDDLDRCQPDKAVLLLESIKHLLWVPGFVFVLALDNEVLERYLQHRYEEHYGLKHDPNIGKRYLEKLVQLTIFLPESEKLFEEYIEGLLALPDGAWRLPKAIVPILAAGTKNNPRNLKRRINDLIVDRIAFGKVEREGQGADDETAVVCLAVHRLLRDVLGKTDFRRLATSDQLCEATLQILAGAGLDGSSSFVSAADGDAVGRSETVERRIAKQLVEHELKPLFEVEGAGQVWFSDHDLRRSTLAFLAESRAVDREGPVDQAALVNEAIRKELGLPPDAPVTSDLRASVTSLDMSSSGLDDQGLQIVGRLGALESLDLSFTQVVDLSPLAGLSGLGWLDLRATKVENLSHLEGLTGLKHLDLSETQVKNLYHLKGLNALEILDLGGTQVEDLSYLEGLDSLQDLDLSRTPVKNISVVTRLTSLRRLVLSNTRVDDLSHLKGLSALQCLHLDGTQVADLDPLKHLFNIKYLNLDFTQVKDLSPLEGLTALMHLYAGDTQVEDLFPVRGLTALQSLGLSGTRVADLSHLKDLAALKVLVLQGTQVKDLSPLKGRPNLRRVVLPDGRIWDPQTEPDPDF